MSGIDLLFLGVVLVAFTGFAVALAYYSQRDRQRKNPRRGIPQAGTGEGWHPLARA